MKKEYIKPTTKIFHVQIPCLFHYSVTKYKDGGTQTFGGDEE